MSKVKYPGAILAIDRRFIVEELGLKQGLNLVPENILHRFEPHLIIKQRTALETDARFMQLLPSVLVRRADRDGSTVAGDRAGVMMYRRTKKVGEQRLAGGTSINLGGHIDAPDFTFDDDGAIDLMATLDKNLWRELREELKGFETIPAGTELKLTFKGLITDYANDVGNHHLALVYELIVPAESELVIGEDELEQIGFIPAEDFLFLMRPVYDGNEVFLKQEADLEPWARILADHLRITEGPGKALTVVNGELIESAFTVGGTFSGDQALYFGSESLGHIPRLNLSKTEASRVVDLLQNVGTAASRTADPAAYVQLIADSQKEIARVLQSPPKN